MLSDLFLDTRDPVFIFNQGRCLEQNRRYEDAIGRFEEYLRTAESSRLNKSDRAAAKKHIAECRESLAQQSSHEGSLPSAPPAAPLEAKPAAPQQASDPAAGVVQPIVAKPSTSTIEPAPSQRPPLRTAGILTAAVGGAALAAGVILNLKVNGMASDMEKPASYSDSKESSRKSYETAGWVSYGLGAACVATGAVLYMLGRGQGDTHPSAMALLPSLGSGRVGAVLQGGF
jgi:hypothetical protein